MIEELKKLENKVIDLKYKKDADVFWHEKYNNKGGKDYTILLPELRTFIHKIGFRSYKGGPVQIKNNIAQKVSSDDIFKEVLKYVESLKEPGLESAFLKQGETHLIKNKSIILGLKECEGQLLKDTKDTSYHPYLNGVVCVQRDQPIKLLPYQAITGFVWDSSVINREFNVLDEDDEIISKAMFYQFVDRITNDEMHRDSLLTVLGYLLHKYKDQSKPVAIIINDENLVSEGKPNGGTGKGILIKAVSKIVEKAMYNGKNADFTNNRFAYQNVKDTTSIIVIDDAPRNFDFEALFSVLTDDMPIERKHKALEVVPYDESPKFVITTNYTIKGNTSSYKRRRFDTYLTNYYNENRTPSQEFSCEFFNGWDKEEWERFDFFMMCSLRMFLCLGIIPYESEEIRLKMLKNETSEEFYELIEESFCEKNTIYIYADIRYELIKLYGEKYHFLENNKKIIVEWVSRYAEFKGYSLVKIRKTHGYEFEFK